jgi:nitrile hydratase
MMTKGTTTVQERCAQLVARAWLDPNFRRKLVDEPLAAFRECGLEPPEGKQIKVLEDSETTQHQPIPFKATTAPGCVPVRDDQPDWYRLLVERAWADDGFRAKLLNDSTTAYHEAGVTMPKGITITWVQDTEQVSHFPLPVAPATEELSEEVLDGVAGGGWREVLFGCYSKGCGCTGVRG